MLRRLKILLVIPILMVAWSGGVVGTPHAQAASGLCPIIDWSGAASSAAPVYQLILKTLPAGTVVHYDLTSSGPALLIFALQDAAMTIAFQTVHLGTQLSGVTTLSADGEYQLAAGALGATAPTYELTLSVSYECGVESAAAVSAGGSICPAVLDGRINADATLDCAAPIAVFVVNGGFDIYEPGAGGAPVLSISAGQIASAGASTDGNVLLAEGVLSSGQSVQLYYLTTGEFSLITTYPDGKPYVIVWATGAADLYHAAG
jgi:hypothetical protein